MQPLATIDAANAVIEEMEAAALQHPQVDCPATHHFGPGTYLREVFMPAGCLVIGHKHREDCVNVLMSGKIRVAIDGVIRDLCAPAVMPSRAGSRKVAYIVEDVRWLTVHSNPTDERDIEVIEARLAEKSGAFLEHEQQMIRALQEEVG